MIHINRKRYKGKLLFILANIMVFFLFAMLGVMGYGAMFLSTVNLTGPITLFVILLFEITMWMIT